MDIRRLTIEEMLDSLRKREFTAVNLAQAYIDAIKISNLNSYITFDEESVIASAKKSDVRIANGTARQFEGLPVGVKDLFCTRGIRTTAGSKMLENFIPPYESTVTQRLWDNGCIMLGKLNCDEFAMGGANIYSYFGKVLNPWDESRIPGGSSGGSAVAVAAGLAPIALGSDTGGSCRQPGAHTGTVGLKPSYGRVSRYGIVPFAQSFDQAGLLARSVKESAMLLEVIAGYDEKDSTSEAIPVAKFTEKLGLKHFKKGFRIGIPKEVSELELCPEIRAYWDQMQVMLKEQGSEIIEVSLPNMCHSLDIYQVLAYSEGYSSLARYDGIHYGFRADGKNLQEIYRNTRTEGFGEEVKRRLLIGAYMLSSEHYEKYYTSAGRMRSCITQEFNKAFELVDAMFIPSTPMSAPKYDEICAVELYKQDMLTTPVNAAGLCGVSVPVGLAKNGIPIGLQIIANRFCEQNMFALASVVEELAQFNKTCYEDADCAIDFEKEVANA
jgi:aspartyl-tRNA(Asn)/glutamyl-tRNA(Gln) amidotransferase subunit A